MAGLYKPRLIDLVLQEGLCPGLLGGSLEDCVGKVFENFVVQSFGLQRNYKSYIPEVWTHGMREAVVPDAVSPHTVIRPDGVTIYPESSFLEVKAILPGIIGISGFGYQLLGMIDVLAGCPAAKAGAPGQLVVVTTAGVIVSPQLLIEATISKVAFWHAQVNELDGGLGGTLQVGLTSLQNPIVYKTQTNSPLWPTIGPKPPGRLK